MLTKKIGFHQYSASDKIHTKAIRSYLGVGHSAPLCALRSEMAWLEPRSRTQIKMLRFYYRLKDMDNNRLTKKILLYDQNLSNCNPNLPTWSSEIKQITTRNNLLFSIDRIRPKLCLQMLHESLLKKDIIMFRQECLKLPKLRTYNTLFSPFIDHMSTVNYTRLCLPFIKRKRIAQIRLGVLPIRIETDRYLRVKIPAEQRYCMQPNCTNAKTLHNLKIENKFHFLVICKEYEQSRNNMYDKV